MQDKAIFKKKVLAGTDLSKISRKPRAQFLRTLFYFFDCLLLIVLFYCFDCYLYAVSVSVMFKVLQ